jgi:hypothetical protein
MPKHIDVEETEEEDISLYNREDYHLCEHVFHDGSECQCVAGANHKYCHWHTTSEQRLARRTKYAKRRTKNSILGLVIPNIEDAYSLQVAVHEVIDAIVEGRVKDRSAGHLLYALQISQNNLKGKIALPTHRRSKLELKFFLETQLEDQREAERTRARERANKKPPQPARIAENEEVSVTS